MLDVASTSTERLHQPVIFAGAGTGKKEPPPANLFFGDIY